MIPVQLTIEGLYSYQKRQTIDFNKLIDAGLFGIFGAVGSGKSSILEAITFALYGETERLNSKEKRSYNMMNLKSNLSYIEFDFLNFEDKLYRITREFKRNSKRFDDIKTSTVVFYENVDGNWLPLNHTNAELIIGLSYSNFKRTIIIPQGQFKEFIELKATARTEMMQEIFNLHKYDLSNNVGKLTKDNTTDLNILEGKLQGFETVSLDVIAENQNQLKADEENYKIILGDFKTINESFQRLKSLKADFESLNQKKIQFNELKSLKDIKDQEQIRLDQYELISKMFYQLLIDKNKIEKLITEDDISLKQHIKQSDLIENQIKEITLKIESIQKDFNALSDKKIEESDLELIIQILNYKDEIKELQARTIKGIAKVNEVEGYQKQIEEKIKTSEEEIKFFNSNRIDPQVLMAVDNWFVQKNSIDQLISKQSKKIQDLKIQIEHSSKILLEEKIDILTFETDFSGRLKLLIDQKKDIENQKNEYIVQQKIAHFAHDLNDGESCPLCGSLDHPKVVEMDDVTQKITSTSDKINALEKDIDKLQNRYSELQQLIYQNGLLKNQIEQENIQLNLLEDQLKNHSILFSWKDFDHSNFENFLAKKENALNIEKNIEQKNIEISSQRELLEKARLEVEKYKQFLEKFKLDEVQKASQIQQNLSNLKFIKFIEFENSTIIEVENKLVELKLSNQKIENDYNQFQQFLNDLNPKFAAQKTSIQLLENRLENQKNELIQLNNLLQEALIKAEIESLDEVKSILVQNLDISNLRKELEEFRFQFGSLEKSIQELEEKLLDVLFDEETFDKQKELFNQTESRLNEANEVVIKRNTEISRLIKAYEDKKEILEEQNKLQKRADLLKLFSNMFKGAGFVQYVSSIFLKQLCENANIRFHRMTKNQLSLQINDNYDFEIIDYLNEGRARSVKTLSGGQAFQVSLSLALALAESVQSNLKASKNFFFIDEGFGTQDADAINIVFETLNHLHKENRIVGIISHVEELKERIPMTISVVKDEEIGSQISIN